MPDLPFNNLRPRLFGIAYRMLGTKADAEDALQDVYLRWHGADKSQLQLPEAWLVTVTTRLCIDRLRAAKVEREAYTGPWLPEPLVETAPSPETAVELAGDLSMALLTVLERLAPEERAAFLLREIFDADYDEIARVLDKSEPACRQLVSRAKTRVRDERPRFEVTPEAHTRLLEKFVEAARGTDPSRMLALLAPEAIMVSDGGGKVLAALRVLHGAPRLTRLFEKIGQRLQGRITFRPAQINGEPGILRLVDGELDTVFAFVTDGEHIHEIYAVRNPDKLRNIVVH